MAVIANLSQRLAGLEAALTSAWGSCAASPGLGWCWPPGSWPSSATTPTAMPVPRPARPSPAPPPSPGLQGCCRWWWPGRSATGGFPLPVTCGRSPPSPAHLASAAPTTPIGPVAPPTIRPCGRWPTGWSASCTAAFAAAASTTSDSPGRPSRLTRPPARARRVLPCIALLLANGVVPTTSPLSAPLAAGPGQPRRHVAVGGVLVGRILVQLLVIGFLAPAFQRGYLTPDRPRARPQSAKLGGGGRVGEADSFGEPQGKHYPPRISSWRSQMRAG